MLPGQGLQLAFFRLHQRFKRPRKDGARHIHAADFEHQRGGLHFAVVAPQPEGRTGARCNVAVAGTVHQHLRPERLASAFAFGNDAADAAAGLVHAADGGIQPQRDARFVQHFEIRCFQQLRVNGFRLRCAKPVVPVHPRQQFAVQPTVYPAGKVAHHSAGGHSAHAGLLLNQQRFSARTRCGDGGRKSGRPAACDDDFVVPCDRHAPRRFRNHFRIHETIPPGFQKELDSIPACIL